MTAKSVGRETASAAAGPWACGRGVRVLGVMHVFTASMLTILRFISLIVALAAGSARVTGLDASKHIFIYMMQYDSLSPWSMKYV